MGHWSGRYEWYKDLINRPKWLYLSSSSWKSPQKGGPKMYEWGLYRIEWVSGVWGWMRRQRLGTVLLVADEGRFEIRIDSGGGVRGTLGNSDQGVLPQDDCVLRQGNELWHVNVTWLCIMGWSRPIISKRRRWKFTEIWILCTKQSGFSDKGFSHSFYTICLIMWRRWYPEIFI